LSIGDDEEDMEAVLVVLDDINGLVVVSLVG